MRSIPLKYVPEALSKADTKKQHKEINKSRKLYKNKKYHTRKKVTSFKNKRSKHIVNAERIYKTKNIVPSNELAKKTGCSISALNHIVKKGQGAYFSSGSRPNQTGHSWAYARLGSSITGGKSAAIDFHILEKGCKKSSKALKLAKKSRKLHKYGTRKVRKFKGGMKLGKTMRYMATAKRNKNRLPLAPQKPPTMTQNRWTSHVKLAKELEGKRGIPTNVLTDDDKEKIHTKAKELAERDIARRSDMDKKVSDLITKIKVKQIEKALPHVPKSKI